MSNNRTIARPYAKALFNSALEHNLLQEWSHNLHTMVALFSQKEIQQFCNHPKVSKEQQCDLLEDLLKTQGLLTQTQMIHNFIHTLVYNNRLGVLAEIALLFDRLRADYEKTAIVEVISFSELTTEQKERLMDTLSKKLNRTINSLHITIDKTILGGAIIKASRFGLIIDGSVRGKLEKLRDRLVA